MFYPTDFIQINADINQKMIDQAIDWLALDSHDRVLDLFCGIGNFSLPMARYAGHVSAVEGCPIMAKRVLHNAEHNGLANMDSYVSNLMDPVADAAWWGLGYNKVLLDPPRSGVAECVPWLLDLAPERIVYVSCNPATLARDAGLIVAGGYRLVKVGVMDMFPHTSHVETMALFMRS